MPIPYNIAGANGLTVILTDKAKSYLAQGDYEKVIIKAFSLNDDVNYFLAPSVHQKTDGEIVKMRGIDGDCIQAINVTELKNKINV